MKNICLQRLGLVFIALSLLTACQTPQQHSVGATRAINEPWVPDLGNDNYKNPVLHADYSDPDVIRVGDTYYLTSSSFNNTPGLPLLQSKDMVNWELVGHALTQQIPTDVFEKVQRGKGVWAPCLRFHENKFWIFYPDPDYGVYVVSAENFAGPWSAPHMLLPGKGIIDPTPLWDDDGKAYLLHGWAKSRAGINNMLTLHFMSPDASRLLDAQGTVVVDANKIPDFDTLEGPKFYKYRGYYYIFAPAGGVATGWQTVFRSRNIEGPYETRIVMAQGGSNINGPHQGAWVQKPEGTDWFFHFQDTNAYGRVVHLQPMIWKDGWPIIGEDKNNTGIGEPIWQHKKPVAGNFPIVNPATSDEFSLSTLGLQWQWNANWKADWYSLTAHKNHLRFYSQYDETLLHQNNYFDVVSILLQKMPAEEFVTTTSIDTSHQQEGATAGLIMYGLNYAWLGVKQVLNKKQLAFATCIRDEAQCKDKIAATVDLKSSLVYLRMRVNAGGITQFSYSLDNNNFTLIGEPFTAAMGRWVGAQMGLFNVTDNKATGKNSFIDVDYFRVTK